MNVGDGGSFYHCINMTKDMYRGHLIVRRLLMMIEMDSPLADKKSALSYTLALALDKLTDIQRVATHGFAIC